MAAVYNPDLSQPYAQWEEVDVTFPVAPNTDCIVSHTLNLSNPEAVSYVPIRKAQAADVYHDVAALRKPWQPTYIILRSTVASAKVTLFLYVSHSPRRAYPF